MAKLTQKINKPIPPDLPEIPENEFKEATKKSIRLGMHHFRRKYPKETELAGVMESIINKLSGDELAALFTILAKQSPVHTNMLYRQAIESANKIKNKDKPSDK
jgi:hypothetical protein